MGAIYRNLIKMSTLVSWLFPGDKPVPCRPLSRP